VLPSQQPPAHEDALQTQSPFTHFWLATQVAQLAAPVPHDPND
jgi:hypothetical protein